MSTMKRKSALQRLPLSLGKRLKKGATEEDRKAQWEALVGHYRLAKEWQALSAESSVERRAVFWERLATRLLLDFVPGFTLAASGRKARFGEVHPEDWSEAGGSLLGFPDDMTAFYQAQLVELIARLEAEKGKSREWVFRWLANEIEKVGPHKAAERRAMLPRPYRTRKTAKSIRVALGSIPREVRDNPAAHLPSREPPPDWVLGAFALLRRNRPDLL